MVSWINLPGPIDYLKGLKIMEEKVQEVIEKQSQETIYLLEHKAVYTAGSSYKEKDLVDPGFTPVVYTGRGGQFTYHNEGQRVIYPILNLAGPKRQKDLKLYVRMLEKWIINSLAEFNVESFASNDRIGIWVNLEQKEKKIAAIGIRIKKWVTYHGVAVNIFNRLEGFSGIIPCGLKNFGVTSLAELGIKVSFEEFDSILKKEFNKIFG